MVCMRRKPFLELFYFGETMTIVLAFLIIGFVSYVLYEICASIQPATDGQAAAVLTPVAVEAHLALVETPVVDTPALPTSYAESATVAKIAHLRNPETGEVSPVPGNYRFAKKWIKEAMVSEGLLKKVYKNSELTEALNTQAKEALEQFKKLERYHG